ncbi:MAG TPA: nucleotidyltransferase domain-containing protein [Gemmataceae bacterium]|nr:nucleotidyltransferase domain-containing protein [Gemmataceae bacterium]
MVKSIIREKSVRNRKGLVSQSVVRTMVRRIVRRFHPERIILFGSYAYGDPDADSDVDVLVVMAARNETDQAVRIRELVDPHFALDIIVRTPRNLAWRLEEGDWFLREIVGKGKILYEKADSRMGGQGRRGLGRGGQTHAAYPITPWIIAIPAEQPRPDKARPPAAKPGAFGD